VIQQDIHWWIAKENVVQFRAQLKDSARDNRRPMFERLLDLEVEDPSALPNVMPRFYGSLPVALKTTLALHFSYCTRALMGSHQQSVPAAIKDAPITIINISNCARRDSE
jgi:hypothetical protein